MKRLITRTAGITLGILAAIGVAFAAETINRNFSTVATGNVSGQSSSVDSEIALFSGTGGKTIKRATGTGLVLATSGVYGNLAVTDDSVPVGNGTTAQAKVLTDCDGASSAVTYDTTTNAWGCNSISGGASETTGNFTVTWATGCTTQPTQVWNYSKIGSQVMVRMTQGVSCTSNTTTHFTSTAGDLPATLRPATDITMFGVGITNNGSTLSHGCVSISSAGTIIVELQQSGRCANNGYTSSGTRQIRVATQEGQDVFSWTTQ